MNKPGAVLATVNVYGKDGMQKEFQGYTMSSDPARFGVAASGEYSVTRAQVPGPFASPWAVNNRGKVPARNNFNPAYPERRPGYLDGVFIHRSNNNGYAGIIRKVGSTGGISEGCLLIHPANWQEFNNQLATFNEFHLQINR